jgi:predicted esterase
VKTVNIFIIMLLLPAALLAQVQDVEYEYENYADMRAEFGRLYNEGKLEEGARLLEWAMDEFPDNRMANSFNLALIYARLDQAGRAARVLLSALDNGVFFSVYAFDHELFDPLREMDLFEEFTARNEEKINEARKNSVSKYSVVTPEGYEEGKEYPLFIALHGGGGNMEDFKGVWKSSLIDKEFIALFVQSSLVVSMNGYSWTEDLEVSKREIKDAYDEVVRNYAIDDKEIIVGGFSSGGVASLEVSLCNTLPVAGFVVLCPPKPESFTEENLAAAKDRGLRGTILTTEMDGRLESQKEMAAMMKKVGFEHVFRVTPDIGHWFPEDLDVQIDEAINHIRNRK